MRVIALCICGFLIVGCSFSKKDMSKRVPSEDTKAVSFTLLKDSILNKTPAEVREDIDLNILEINHDQQAELLELAIIRGNQEVFSLLLRKGFFYRSFQDGTFLKTQRKMNLDIRSSLTAYLSTDLEKLVQAAEKNSHVLREQIENGARTCAGFWSQLLFLRWSKSDLVSRNETVLVKAIADAGCRLSDEGLSKYYYRNELAYLYLNNENSLQFFNEISKLAKSSTSSYFSGNFSWGGLLLSPLLILKYLPGPDIKDVERNGLQAKLMSELEDRADIAYYLIARSGAYRVGHFSNTVELVSLEKHLMDQVVQQNADFVFERYVPVDQDIKLP